VIAALDREVLFTVSEERERELGEERLLWDKPLPV